MNNAWGSGSGSDYYDSIIASKRSMLENTLLQRCKLAVIHNGMSIQQFTQRLEVVLRKEILGVGIAGSSSRGDHHVAFEKQKSSSPSCNNNYDCNDTNMLYSNVVDKGSMTSSNYSNTNDNKSSLSGYNNKYDYNDGTNDKLYYNKDKSSMTINDSNNSNTIKNRVPQQPKILQQYKPLLHESKLVTQNDYGLVPDCMFLAYAQLISCRMEGKDQVGSYRERPIGFVGLCCRHCYDKNVGPGYGGRYFPDSIRSLAQTTTTKTVVKHITSKCYYIPSNIKVRFNYHKVHKTPLYTNQ